jgi:hypothetical protein
MTKAKINRAIRHLGLSVEGSRGDAYFYFLDAMTGDQIGPSVLVAALNHLTLEQWIHEAENAITEHEMEREK